MYSWKPNSIVLRMLGLKATKKASILINLTIDDNLIVLVKNFIAAIETWQALREIHEQHKISSKLYLLRKQYNTNGETSSGMGKHDKPHNKNNGNN